MKLHLTATSVLTVWPVGRAGGSPEGRRASGQEGAEATGQASHARGRRTEAKPVNSQGLCSPATTCIQFKFSSLNPIEIHDSEKESPKE